MKQSTRVLKAKSLASLKQMTVSFNSTSDDGRATSVLLYLQHAFEMLLKASLEHRKIPVFDKKLGRSIGFNKCLELARQDPEIALAPAEAGTLRAIDALRDDEQHWFNIVDEQILFIHARAGVTLFDELLARVFKEHLADHLPVRVLPISTVPPEGLEVLIDREYEVIKELLRPGKRARNEASARIRTLLAIEGHVSEDSLVSEKDVARVRHGIMSGKDLATVFPALEEVRTTFTGAGPTLCVKIDKKAGPSVRLTSDDSDAAAIREVDLQKKYHWSATGLAEKLDLTVPQSLALRCHLGIDEDPTCRHVFEMGKQSHPRFSDKALSKMRDSLRVIGMVDVWEGHKPVGRATQPRQCTAPGCANTNATT